MEAENAPDINRNFCTVMLVGLFELMNDVSALYPKCVAGKRMSNPEAVASVFVGSAETIELYPAAAALAVSRHHDEFSEFEK